MKLFIYFCGTSSSTIDQFTRFIKNVSADYYIIINGPGTTPVNYRTTNVNGYTYRANRQCQYVGSNGFLQNSNNSRSYFLEENGGNNKKVITVEKKYAKGTTTGGLSLNDTSKTSDYVLQALDLLDTRFGLSPGANLLEGITHIMVGGHSRGAAVMLPSFLYKFTTNNIILHHQFNVTFTLCFLDPVAGQTGNKYPMGDQWQTLEMYQRLANNNNPNAVQNLQGLNAYEMYSNGAPMPGGVTNFNPAQRFINRQNYPDFVYRLFFGFRHGSMVTPNELYNNQYRPNDYGEHDSPYVNICVLLNQLFNNYGIINVPERRRQFNEKDGWLVINNPNESNQLQSNFNGRHTTFKGVDLDSFVDNYETSSNLRPLFH